MAISVFIRLLEGFFSVGHVDLNEDLLGTAEREVEEESGLERGDYQIEEGFVRVLSYFDPTKKKDKSVHYWLARINDPDHPIRISKEHQDHKWAELAKACETRRISRTVLCVSGCFQIHRG